MKRQEAIKYLERKKEIGTPRKVIYKGKDETKIKEVMKKGRIYGDPVVILNE